MSAATARKRLSRSTSLRLVTAGGALFMVYHAGVASPAFVQFFREVGADELFFGLLGGIPLIMLSMQFLGALLVNRLRRRKPFFIVLTILARLLYIPIVVLPLLFADTHHSAVMVAVIVLLGISAGVAHMQVPVWYSWMADLIPGRLRGSYWGVRWLWMHVFWAGSLFAIAVFTWAADAPARVVFPIIAGVSVAAGVIDILLFIWVHEPEHLVGDRKPVFTSLVEPFKHSEYRTFLLFKCSQLAGMMVAASFMQVYALGPLNLSVAQNTVLWCMIGVGAALTSRLWGKYADKHGSKPILIICAPFKMVFPVVFLLVTPGNAFWVMFVVFCVGGMWQAGTMVATDSYMTKLAPRENRAMFVAATMGLSGMCGGLASILGGVFMKAISGFEWNAMGRTWTNYHVLFIISLLMRAITAALAHRLSEPKSMPAMHIVHHFRGVWPFRLFRAPVDLYRSAPPPERDADPLDK
jgi:MFS family permease